MRLLIAGMLLAASATACSSGSSPANPAGSSSAPAIESARLTIFLDTEYEEELAMSPEELTTQGRKEQYDRLDDRSDAAEERRLEWRRQSVAKMKAAFDYDRLDDEGKTSFDMWLLELERAERRHAFRTHFYVFTRGGAHTSLPQFLINFHSVADARDLEAYIARLGQLDDVLDQLRERAAAAAAKNIRPPAFAFDQALSEIQRITAGAPFARGMDSALFADVKAKAAALVRSGALDDAHARTLVETAARVLIAEVKPGYDRVAAWLKSDAPHAAAAAQGAASLPGGPGFYNAALALQTTTALTSDEIHALGLSEVARIRAGMEALKTAVGFRGSLREFFAFMRADRQFYFPNTDEGRAAYIALAERYLSDMQKQLPDYFGILPKAGLLVKRVEPFREEPGGAQHYFGGTPDGLRPGIFYAHLVDMNAMPRYQLEDVAYHEGVPGHHLQISIAQERTGVPKFRTQYGYGAFSEGWALYAEALSKEMGFFTDPYSDFGRLSGEIWRAIRLVVDTGLHAKGWSEARAVDYFFENSPLAEGAIRSEVRRYLVTPGQATTYKIGMVTIQRLRDEARTALGPAFDYRRFHDVVLGGGSLPLPVLEARVRRWIQAQRVST